MFETMIGAIKVHGEARRPNFEVQMPRKRSRETITVIYVEPNIPKFKMG